MDGIRGSKLKKLVFRRTVVAKKTKVWEIISDVANYHQVAPNIDDVKIISGKGEGMVRQCTHGNGSWKETCSIWEKEKRFAFEVDTTAPDYPFPFKSLQGMWKINQIGPLETEIIMEFQFAYKIVCKIFCCIHF